MDHQGKSRNRLSINVSSVHMTGSNFNQCQKTDNYMKGRGVILFIYILYITEFFKNKE